MKILIQKKKMNNLNSKIKIKFNREIILIKRKEKKGKKDLIIRMINKR